jgi:hypothetical protein
LRFTSFIIVLSLITYRANGAGMKIWTALSMVC